MPRVTLPTARLLLRALLVLSVMLNGAAISTAGAVPDTSLHARHHGHDDMRDKAMTGDPANQPATDCCDGEACGCGCTASPATLPPIIVRREWTSSQPCTFRVSTFHTLSVFGVPFRPPA